MEPGRICGLRCGFLVGKLDPMPEAVISRDEVIGLLFNVSDIAVTLAQIERRLAEDDGEEEADQG